MFHPTLFPYCDLCWADGELHPAEVRYWSDEAQRTFFACEAHIALLDRVRKSYEFLSEIGYSAPVIALEGTGPLTGTGTE